MVILSFSWVERGFKFVTAISCQFCQLMWECPCIDTDTDTDGIYCSPQMQSPSDFLYKGPQRSVKPEDDLVPGSHTSFLSQINNLVPILASKLPQSCILLC